MCLIHKVQHFQNKKRVRGYNEDKRKKFAHVEM